MLKTLIFAGQNPTDNQNWSQSGGLGIGEEEKPLKVRVGLAQKLGKQSLLIPKPAPK
ncbi:MAG: hypothetical protein RLP02_20695 [Coleofasciculus sp. C2-GNP5-27]